MYILKIKVKKDCNIFTGKALVTKMKFLTA